MSDEHKPVIGISGWKVSSGSVQAMVKRVIEAGGIPLILTNHAERDPAADIQKIDALFVMGNDWDLDPKKYIDRYPVGDPRRTVDARTVNQSDDPLAKARASYEEKMLALAEQKHMPVLAICGGMQTISIMHGGGLLQHIPDLIQNEMHSKNDGSPMVCPVVPVEIQAGSELGAIASGSGAQYLYTPSYPPVDGVQASTENSYHHQALDPDLLGTGLRIVASSEEYRNVDGVKRRLPEAIEPDPQGPLKDWPMIGVQWHPEFGASQVSIDIVKTSVERAAEYSKSTTRNRDADEHVADIEYIKSSQQALPVQVAPTQVTAPLPGCGPQEKSKVLTH